MTYSSDSKRSFDSAKRPGRAATRSRATLGFSQITRVLGISLTVAGGLPPDPPALLETDLETTLPHEVVRGIDEADTVAAGAHDDRVGARRIGHVAHAAQQVAVRDAGRDDDRVAAHELLVREHVLHVLDPELGGGPHLGTGHRPELALELAAEAGQRRG